MGYFTMMRLSIGRKSDVEPGWGEELQMDEVPIIDSNRDLKERFGERFFRSHIFFDKLCKRSFL